LGAAGSNEPRAAQATSTPRCRSTRAAGTGLRPLHRRFCDSGPTTGENLVGAIDVTRGVRRAPAPGVRRYLGPTALHLCHTASWFTKGFSTPLSRQKVLPDPSLHLHKLRLSHRTADPQCQDIGLHLEAKRTLSKTVVNRISFSRVRTTSHMRVRYKARRHLRDKAALFAQAAAATALFPSTRLIGAVRHRTANRRRRYWSARHCSGSRRCSRNGIGWFRPRPPP